MTPIAFVLAATGAAGLAYVVLRDKRKEEKLPPPPSSEELAVATLDQVIAVSPPPRTNLPSAFGPLTRERLYRVWLFVDTAFTAPDQAQKKTKIQGQLTEMGFSQVILAGEDPSTENVWTALARWGRGESTGSNLPLLHIYHLQQVEEPPTLQARIEAEPTLDTGLTNQEAQAVKHAMARETSAPNLRGFAQAMAVDFPMSSSLLHGRAGMIEAGVENPLIASVLEGAARQTVASMNRPSPQAQAAGSIARQILGQTSTPSTGAVDLTSAAAVRATSYGTSQAATLPSAPATKTATYADTVQRQADITWLKVVTPMAQTYSEQKAAEDREAMLQAAVSMSHAYVIVDEHGSPYEMLPEGEMSKLGLPWTYKPRFAPIPYDEYKSWPISVQEAVPYEWTGDLLTFVPAEITVAESRRPELQNRVSIHSLLFNSGPGLNPRRRGLWGEDIGQTGSLQGNAAARVKYLKLLGWGRLNLVKSDKTGGSYWLPYIPKKTFFEGLADTFTEIGRAIAKAFKAIAPIIGLIPGIGTGIAMMLNAGAALALGESLESIAISTLANAIPGGGLVREVAKEAFETAAEMVSGLVQGKPIDQVALGILRSEVTERGGELAASAFDAGIAVAQGKSLQEVGFGVLYSFVKGSDALEKAAQFAEKVVKAAEQGLPVEELLTRELVKEVGALGTLARTTDLGRVVDTLVSNGNLLWISSDQLAETLGVPEAVARAAQAAVKEISVDGKAVRVVDQELMNRLRPREITPSTLSALNAASYKLAVAEARQSLLTTAVSVKVAYPPNLAQRVVNIAEEARQGQPNAVIAQDAIDRAQRVLLRQRWVAFYAPRGAIAA